MACEEERILNLYDSYWSEFNIFTKKPPFSAPEPNPDLEIRDYFEAEEEPKLSRTQTLRVRSFSDHCLSSKDSSISSDSPSPNSVLVPKLQPILSGKEVKEFSSPVGKQESFEIPMEKKLVRERRRRRRRGTRHKSFSELEFEELKGFMDLGFVFSEEDKNSSLVSIIPGLQRLGKQADESDGGDGGERRADVDESLVSRPYLSEAWEVLAQREVEKPFLGFRIPAFGKEMDMKEHLRIWAHDIASTVR